MEEKKDILEMEDLKQAPFTIPEGYFQSVEDKVHEKIYAPTKRERVWIVAKPWVMVAAMFLIIFGIGYATLSLTGTNHYGKEQAALMAQQNAAAEEDAAFSEAIAAVGDEEILEFITDNIYWPEIESFLTENLNY